MVLWRFILLLISAVTIPVHSKFDSNGFLSIDCGLTVNSTYYDPATDLTYVSDEQYIDTGVNSRISSDYIGPNLETEYATLRSFPNGTRNCYTLSLTVGFKYLIRATFYYANYDQLNEEPLFDIYLGVNFWDTVNFHDSFSYSEIIVTATADYLQVCLVKRNGNPFISSLHLRQLNSTIYQAASNNQSLIYFWRATLGGSKDLQYFRYPKDLHDRWWWNYTDSRWIVISTNSTIKPDPEFETPSLVMQTAATTSSTTEPLVIPWNNNNISARFYVILHFAEVHDISSTDQRVFDIYANGISFNNSYIPHRLNSGSVTIVITGSIHYNISLVATRSSTLPPLLNAIELYIISPVVVPTYGGDVAAIDSIKKDHHIKSEWNGDPCVPKELIWTGVSCSSNSNIPRITALNLSSSGLTGSLSYYFGNLSALVSLDLSSNDLSGQLPNSLDQLRALTYLDIRGNSKMMITLPLELQKKQQNGSLTYRFGDINPTPSPSSKKNIIISVAVVVPLLVIAVVVATVYWFRRKHNRIEVLNQSLAAAQDILNIDNRQFSYNDLKRITDDFKNNIGIGGFGCVYLGLLENGFQVAVKMRSHSSTQGVNELLAEAKNLARVHHKNLVTLMGYCIDGNYMALVYEYMQEGNLQQKLKDDVRPLTWKQRLRIAYQSALGLEYLHKACNPPLIHRDVKTSNILLSANLEAKIADFGLSRDIDSDAISHVSTVVVGTPGYLDPEYYMSGKLSAKSDVYSFGVVLLEIITGQPPINEGLEGGSLVKWVHQKLSGGDIENIVDPKMQNKYDINSVWKVTNVACKCTEQTSSRRPSMDAVVSELKESLDLETSTKKMDRESSTDNLVTDGSQDIAFDEMAYMNSMLEPGPSIR